MLHVTINRAKPSNNHFRAKLEGSIKGVDMVIVLDGYRSRRSAERGAVRTADKLGRKIEQITHMEEKLCHSCGRFHDVVVDSRSQ